MTQTIEQANLFSKLKEYEDRIDRLERSLSAKVDDGFYQQAQRILTGGGDITWDGGTRNLRWSTRFIVLGAGRTPLSAASGYFDITVVAGAAVKGHAGAGDRVFSASGVNLNPWETLYYELPMGGFNNSAGVWHIVSYSTGLFNVPSEWLMIASANGDGSYLKLGTGKTLRLGETIREDRELPARQIQVLGGQEAGLTFSNANGWVALNSLSFVTGPAGGFWHTNWRHLWRALDQAWLTVYFRMTLSPGDVNGMAAVEHRGKDHAGAQQADPWTSVNMSHIWFLSPNTSYTCTGSVYVPGWTASFYRDPTYSGMTGLYVPSR